MLNLPYFGEITTDSLNGYYQIDINFGQEQLELDLNFKNDSIHANQLNPLKEYLNDLQVITAIAKTAIADDFENGEDVNEFLTFHLEEVFEEELNSFLSDTDKNLPIKKQLLSKIKLKRIGFYPDSDYSFAVLDFKFDADFSQYILVVNMNDDKTVYNITMES